MTMPNYARHLQSHQMEQDRHDQVQNSASGYVFALTPLKQLERFLILGCEGGTYYATERKLTRENATVVTKCLDAHGIEAVELIASISESGRAPKQDAAIFALALAASHSNEVVRVAALDAMPRICRIGTDLFNFVTIVKTMRGMGVALRRAISNWYNTKDISKLEYQVCKYQQRNGMSHRDVLRIAHPFTRDPGHQALYRWIVGGEHLPRTVAGKGTKKARAYPSTDHVSAYIEGFEQLKTATDIQEACKLIERFRFTHEMVPSELKTSPEVWAALLPSMPLGALTRNLATLTKVGVIAPLSNGLNVVLNKFNKDAIIKTKLHPIKILAALRTYQQGHGERGKSVWNPVPQVIDCLNEAFYDAFEGIEPSGARTLVALDISGSMCAGIGGIPGLTCREATAAMAMVTMRKETHWAVLGFSHQLIRLDVSPSMRLDDICRRIAGLPFGRTNCDLPILSALKKKAEVDIFYVLTDNETWSGEMHPYQALKLYRQKMNIPAKLAVCGMTSTGFSIADPNDAGSIDLVGFDTNAPALLADFSRNPLVRSAGML